MYVSVVAQTKNSNAVLLLEHEATPKGLSVQQAGRFCQATRCCCWGNLSSTAQHLGSMIITDMVESSGTQWTKGFESCTPPLFSIS